MNKGDKVTVTTTGEVDTIDAKVSDFRGELYRTKSGDRWYDERYLTPKL